MREKCNCKFVLAEGAKIPEKKHPEDAGYDIYANENVSLSPGERVAVSTGIKVQPDPGWYIQIVPRSGMAFKSGITVLNSPGTIDSNYKADVKVILVNHGNEVYNICQGDRIAQLIFTPSYEAELEQVLFLDDSDRGEGGFGSTGR